jgi:putative pyruvate formate lyase activating enzyme
MNEIYFVEDQIMVHDPGPEMIPFLSALSPSFRVESVRPGPGFVPKFQTLKKQKVVLDRPLFELGTDDMKSILFGTHLNQQNLDAGYPYSLLNILQSLSLSEISHCGLCGWNCGVNRFSGEKGKCGLDSKAYASRPFIHMAEESVINSALVINLGGCALRCIYCIASKVWDPHNFELLNPKLFWQEIQNLMVQGTPINTLEFTNPTESLPWIIEVLSSAPVSFNLPVVMNCHLYGSKTFYQLASSITDVWLPDLRYGNDGCSKALSGIDDCMSYARLGLDSMCSQNSRVLVRILVLPGHVKCCHEPSLEFLSEYKDKVWVSVLDQYVPEHQSHLDPNLRRRPTKEEIAEVEGLVEKFGLRKIDTGKQSFWA